MTDYTPPPIQLTDEEIREFMAIYKEEFHEELTFEEARAMATRVMTLFAVLTSKEPESHDPAASGKETSVGDPEKPGF